MLMGVNKEKSLDDLSSLSDVELVEVFLQVSSKISEMLKLTLQP